MAEAIQWTINESLNFADSSIEAMDAVGYAEYLELGENARMSMTLAERQSKNSLEDKVQRTISARNQRAADIRHARTSRKVKAYATEGYLRYRSRYANPAQATKSLLPDVRAYARELNTTISEKQLYRHLLEAERSLLRAPGSDPLSPVTRLEPKRQGASPTRMFNVLREKASTDRRFID